MYFTLYFSPISHSIQANRTVHFMSPLSQNTRQLRQPYSAYLHFHFGEAARTGSPGGALSWRLYLYLQAIFLRVAESAEARFGVAGVHD